MKLYDEIIDGWSALLEDFSLRSLPLSGLWPDTGERNMILRSDMAYELGGGSLPALGATAVTVGGFAEDRLLLCGPDLPEILCPADGGIRQRWAPGPGRRTVPGHQKN